MSIRGGLRTNGFLEYLCGSGLSEEGMNRPGFTGDPNS